MVGAGGVTGLGKGGGGPEGFAAGGSIGGGGGVGGTTGAGGFGISREGGSFMEMGGSTGFGSGEGGGGVTGCRAGVGGAAVARRVLSSGVRGWRRRYRDGSGRWCGDRRSGRRPRRGRRRRLRWRSLCHAWRERGSSRLREDFRWAG